jgi:hypothetical protein
MPSGPTTSAISEMVTAQGEECCTSCPASASGPPSHSPQLERWLSIRRRCRRRRSRPFCDRIILIAPSHGASGTLAGSSGSIVEMHDGTLRDLRSRARMRSPPIDSTDSARGCSAVRRRMSSSSALYASPQPQADAGAFAGLCPVDVRRLQFQCLHPRLAAGARVAQHRPSHRCLLTECGRQSRRRGVPKARAARDRDA